MHEQEDMGVGPGGADDRGPRGHRELPHYRSREKREAEPRRVREPVHNRPRRQAPVVVTTHHRRRRRTGLVLAFVAIFLVAGVAAAWATLVPVGVTVDGHALRVQPRSTVGELVGTGAVVPQPGVLHALDGSVLASAPGPAGVVLVNGRTAPADQRVRAGDRIATKRGPEATETVMARQVPTPFRTVVKGFGEREKVVTVGEPGVALEWFGRYSGEVVRSEVLIEPVNQVVERSGGDRTTKLVALTFDDGPWGPKDQTERILDILDEYDIKATFFMLGNRVKVNGDIAAEVEAHGHLLGNHSFSHPDLTGESAAEIRKQVRRTTTLIENATGERPRWFRAPGGAVDAQVRSIVEAEGMTIAHWTIGTGDWKNLGSQRIVDIVDRKVKPGAIVLLHDGGGTREDTIEALPGIIERLRDKGYRFVTLEELPCVPGAGERY